MIARLLFPALLLAVLAAACGGGGGNGDSPIEIEEATSERGVSSTGRQSSTVTLRFDREVSLARSQVPLASRIEVDMPDVISGGTRRVLVASAEVHPNDGRTILVTVSEPVPEGARIRIDRRAFDADAEGELLATVSSDLTPGFALLATTAFQSFLPGLLEQPEVPPVTDADRDPAAMRQLLEEHLANRGTNDDLRAQALAAYDAMPAEIVPSPKLRAALAALTGTFANPAIDYLLTDQNCTREPAALIAFQPPPEIPELLGRSTRSPDGARVISINPVTEGDRLEHLMALLTHEAIHCDRISGRFEEIAATAFDTFLYMQLIAADPTLVESNTPLSRDLNVDVIALINSGRAVPESVGILQSSGVTQAVPGSSSTAPSFGDLVIAAYESIEFNESAAEPLARAYVELLAQLAGMDSGPPFDLVYLDELLGRAMPPSA
ncbi:MAG: hypothetical protein WED87_05655, partial [Dehalococcoidia bacterium]